MKDNLCQSFLIGMCVCAVFLRARGGGVVVREIFHFLYIFNINCMCICGSVLFRAYGFKVIKSQLPWTETDADNFITQILKCTNLDLKISARKKITWQGCFQVQTIAERSLKGYFSLIILIIKVLQQLSVKTKCIIFSLIIWNTHVPI